MTNPKIAPWQAVFRTIDESGYTIGSDVFIIAGAIVCPVLASIYFLSMLNNWTMEREGWAVKWTFRYAIAAIIIVVLALVFFR
jgi:hypothetical protein